MNIFEIDILAIIDIFDIFSSLISRLKMIIVDSVINARIDSVRFANESFRQVSEPTQKTIR